MEEHIIKELEHYGQMLENHFHDMVDIEFTVENGKLYILSGRVGKRTALANLRIVISMFCEGKMSVSDVFQKLPYQQVMSLLDREVISNEHELKRIGQGMPASGGVASATVCYTALEAENLIEQKEEFIFCQIELSPEVIHIVESKYCRGIITARGGMTSHAAVVCRGIHKPCVAGIGDIYEKIRELSIFYNNEITINANNGLIYAGIGVIEKNNANLMEVKILHELLINVIKYNIITPEVCPLIWRLWDIMVLNKRYGKDNTKQLVIKNDYKYISFKKPEKSEIDSILLKLQYVPNSGLLIEDLIGFLFDELSAQVPLGSHYLYTRPLLNPIDAIEYSEKDTDIKYSGIQLTGVEFFQINKFVDFLLDIYSVKVYFSTAFYSYTTEGLKNNYEPLNYLDYTNPHGESLIINTYDAIKIAVYINDVLISPEELPKVYHLLRRRKYHWTWYKDNNVSKSRIVDYLKTNKFKDGKKGKLYFLCQEMHLIYEDRLTLTGVSLLEEKKVESNNNIDYILDEVLSRGYSDSSNECNDFSKLILRKDFKDLIALELYEYYFWDERHEFDLQLLKEIVEDVAAYFSNPAVIKQIEAGLLQTIPSALVLSCVAAIWTKLKTVVKKKKYSKEDDSSWSHIQENMKKIDKEFANHDYVLTEEIETVFGESREEIQPLLKLCGCKCYVYKNRSIWIKVGTKEERVKEILKIHHFKYKR